MEETPPTVKATIYITRHGECYSNTDQKALDPWTDNLTDVGKEQAQLLGTLFKDVAFTRIYSSDFPRAYETAKAILDKNTVSSSLEIKSDTKLQERGYLGVIGLDAKLMVSRVMEKMKAGTPFLKVDIPGCETVDEVENRIISFYSELLGDIRSSVNSEETILIVSHSLAIQRLMILLNTRWKEFGIAQWTQNRYSERFMRNTTFHKLVFNIPKGTEDITGFVDQPHCRDHVTTGSSGTDTVENVNDTKNYTFLENQEFESHEAEMAHYCQPV